jgi:glutaminase
VLAKVGVEPRGEAFDSIVLDKASKRPYNPMMNSGAIAITSLIKGADPPERLNRMLEMFQRYVGHDIGVDISVFASERSTGDSNRAIAYMMRSYGMLDRHLDEILDLYFQQCSILVNCSDLAKIAATLANRGVNPVTDERAVDAAYVKDFSASCIPAESIVTQANGHIKSACLQLVALLVELWRSCPVLWELGSSPRC